MALIVEVQAILDYTHIRKGMQLERLGVIPMQIDPSDWQYAQMRLEFLPAIGGAVTVFANLDILRQHWHK